ncbi:MAG: prepilin-type N-terminal cleavage/methylation domain-containing protein, partial [Lentisphaerota bacterium]
MKKKIFKKKFTLIELMAAMGVFAIIMLIMLTFFNSAQKAWTNCINRGQIYENARIAMDLIARDLQCVYYEKEKVPFWHKGYTSYAVANAVYNQEALCFVSVTSITPEACKSKI